MAAPSLGVQKHQTGNLNRHDSSSSFLTVIPLNMEVSLVAASAQEARGILFRILIDHGV